MGQTTRRLRQSCQWQRILVINVRGRHERALQRNIKRRLPAQKTQVCTRQMAAVFLASAKEKCQRAAHRIEFIGWKKRGDNARGQAICSQFGWGFKISQPSQPICQSLVPSCIKLPIPAYKQVAKPTSPKQSTQMTQIRLRGDIGV